MIKPNVVKIIKTITLLLFGMFTMPVFAAVTPSEPTDKNPVIDIRKIKAKEIERLTGKKLTLLEKIQLKILQKKLKKYDDEEITTKQKKQATWSMILGILSIVLLFIPGIGLLAIPAAILAIIFGVQSIKGNSNAKGIVGIVTGSVTLFLILLAIAFIAAFLGAF